MNPTRINRITDILNEIREIDQYLEGVREMGENLVEGEMMTELTLTGNKPKTEKVCLDKDGSLVSESSKNKTEVFIVNVYGRNKKIEFEQTPDAEIHHNISQTVSLKILAILVEEKQKIKNDLLIKLERLGMKIS
ncbi:hypothetical protein [Salinimicrobium sp. GXAS 041]|uniref:hypothetical protein n=1 Tax=Salinimicrobium sp. GXAS 041 TaxID=3400806 RepID=UPI003C7620F3